ncbi:MULTISPECIES: hypothetical protein [Psychrilyobacter]|uniref:DUF3847 domain-containing protein n=1 Tax=Psychrilyobacter piezotolerans TaxID=2293438 RepID=A0ABX9KIA1_9FUSO|nr:MULTISPECIES: hypothetical protein [Psychrilyobacter]MCS5420275.1 hypothetical protein [Psychrilyobacter sp. S5]NDI77300.1 hypothetical protein [Psychrilyobacter piezotolerans]RDE63354.1 hypothetical protein DV867_05640 [Psychrilyobacter sp. S5]REI41896.1 hypothetical protein DYH56_05640 [Psychrilyobacter piezotolerans]
MNETTQEKQLTPLEKLEIKEQKLLIEKNRIIRLKKELLKKEEIKQEKALINFVKSTDIFKTFSESKENKKIIFGGIIHAFNAIESSNISETNTLKNLVNNLEKKN